MKLPTGLSSVELALHARPCATDRARGRRGSACGWASFWDQPSLHSCLRWC